MMRIRIASIALAAVTFASPAEAGCCCPAPCIERVPPIVVYRPHALPRIYVVEQGPVYSGHGIYTEATVEVPHRLPRYPYVGRVYRGHPGALRARAENR